MFACVATAFHWAISFLMKAANSAGVSPTMRMDCATISARVGGSLSAATIWSCSFLMIGAGVLAGASEEQQRRLREYGRAVGMAFQITDDVLDLTASELVLGKPVASDLREGKATLAVIHALERCTAEERAKIQTVLEQRAFNGVSHQDILDILARYGSIPAASQEAAHYAQHAVAQLEDFPENEFKRALLWIPSFVVSREK